MSPNWRIERLEAAQEGVTTLNCLEGNYPAVVSLIDTTTGNRQVVTLCLPIAPADVCETMDLLSGAVVGGHDWDGECPP